MIAAAVLLVLLAVLFLVLAAINKLPLWPAVLCLILERVMSVFVSWRV